MDEQDYEWISVSEMAERAKVTTQLIYQRIKEGKYEVQQFKRGKMNGYLIRTPKIKE